VENFSYKIFPYGKFSEIFFQKIFRFLKSSLNISFFNLFQKRPQCLGCFVQYHPLRVTNNHYGQPVINSFESKSASTVTAKSYGKKLWLVRNGLM
jgi:hypothetical protein